MNILTKFRIVEGTPREKDSSHFFKVELTTSDRNSQSESA